MGRRRGHAAALRSDRRESDAVCRYRRRRDVLVIGMGASGATGNNVSGMSVAAYVNIEGTGLGFA